MLLIHSAKLKVVPYFLTNLHCNMQVFQFCHNITYIMYQRRFKIFANLVVCYLNFFFFCLLITGEVGRFLLYLLLITLLLVYLDSIRILLEWSSFPKFGFLHTQPVLHGSGFINYQLISLIPLHPTFVYHFTTVYKVGQEFIIMD